MSFPLIVTVCCSTLETLHFSESNLTTQTLQLIRYHAMGLTGSDNVLMQVKQ